MLKVSPPPAVILISSLWRKTVGQDKSIRDKEKDIIFKELEMDTIRLQKDIKLISGEMNSQRAAFEQISLMEKRLDKRLEEVDEKLKSIRIIAGKDRPEPAYSKARKRR